MKKLLVFCLAIVMLVSVFCPAVKAQEDYSSKYSGTVYYVDPSTGANTNDGLSPETAWKSVVSIRIKMLKPGDALLIKRGEVLSAAVGIKFTVSGEEDKPITISCYGDENLPLPIVQASLVSASSAIIAVESQSYIHIDSLHIISKHTGTNNHACIGLFAADGVVCKGNKITNCVVESQAGEWNSTSGSNTYGIKVTHRNYWGFHQDVLIENNEIYNVKGKGIATDGAYGACNKNGLDPNTKATRGLVIRNNFLYNIGLDGINVLSAVDPLVEYNTCGMSHSYAKTSWHVAMWPFSSYGAVFQYNESYETQTTYDGQGFDSDYLSYNTTFQYNYSHDNVGGFMLICTEPKADWLSDQTAYNVGTVVRYNISQNDKHHLFGFTCHITDTMIYNNTIYATDGVDKIVNVYSRDGIKMPINTKFYNNIFYTNKGGFNWEKSVGTEFKNNIFFGENAKMYPKNDVDESIDDGIISSGNIFENPMLLKAGGAGIGRETCGVYRLKPDSPALNAGLIIDDETNTLDFFGNEVNKNEAPNIGAYNGDGVVLV
ncbi:MAG: hypothetical protein IJD90_02850, partial [Clostridia bacterium]|nr:hypothetical protein [Clostridia bacterium]